MKNDNCMDWFDWLSMTCSLLVVASIFVIPYLVIRYYETQPEKTGSEIESQEIDDFTNYKNQEDLKGVRCFDISGVVHNRPFQIEIDSVVIDRVKLIETGTSDNADAERKLITPNDYLIVSLKITNLNKNTLKFYGWDKSGDLDQMQTRDFYPSLVSGEYKSLPVNFESLGWFGKIHIPGRVHSDSGYNDGVALAQGDSITDVIVFPMPDLYGGPMRLTLPLSKSGIITDGSYSEASVEIPMEIYLGSAIKPLLFSE